MANRKTGSTGKDSAGPRDEPVSEPPRGYSIYSEKAERQAAADNAPLGDAGAPPEPRGEGPGDVSGDLSGGAPSADPTPSGSPFASSPEPRAPDRPLFADADGPATPMTPEEAAREASEDAELLGAVDDSDVREKSGGPRETTTGVDARPDTDRDAGREPAGTGEKPMPETVAARPAPRPRPEPERPEPERGREAAYTAPPPRNDRAPARSGSWAGRLLTALLLLLIGAGLALWFGPRLAPNLPAPIAEFLRPAGAETEARMAELEQAVTDLRAELANRPAGVTEDQVSSAVATETGRIDGEITALRDQIGAGAEVPERLARVESAVEGAQAEMTALRDQLGTSGAGVAASPDLDVYQGELDGLRAEMGTLSDQVAGLRDRVDQVGAEARRQIETAQETVATVQEEANQAVDTAARQADVAAVGAAIAAGQPFAEPLGRLAGMPDVTIPAGLTAAAESGVPSLPALRDSFPEAAHAAIRASIVAAAGDGMADRALALVRSQFATRSLTPEEGNSPNAIVSRMGDRLGDDDLAGALAESEALPSEAQAAMGDWLTQARLRVDANAGLTELQSATPATN